MGRKLWLASGFVALALVAAKLAAAPGPAVQHSAAPVAPVVQVPAALATLDVSGGEVRHEGATLHVPAGALHEATEFALQAVPLPAPLAAGFRAASPVVRFTKSVEGRFAKPVTITLPVDEKADLHATVALYWDEQHALYRTLTVTDRDERARTISFETVHFTDYLAATPLDEARWRAATSIPEVDTGFRPEKDAFFFTNGDYDSGGTCLGMSLLSTWYFEAHKNDPQAPPLHDLLAGFHPVAQTADLVGREMALAAQAAAVPKGAYLAPASKAALDAMDKRGEVASGVALAEQLRVTGTPQLLVIEGPRGAHAIVAYAYKDGAFLIYDPNFPLQEERFPFDLQKGFHDFTGTNLGQPLHTAPVSFSSYAADVDFEKIFAKALQDGGDPSRYRDVTVTTARADGDDLVVTGTAQGGLRTPANPSRRVALVVGGEVLATGSVDSQGHFALLAPLASVAEATQRLHVGPAVVLGDGWSFAGATSVPTSQPSKTAGLTGVLPGQ